MQRKDFLRNGIGILGVASLLDACTKNVTATTTTSVGTAGNCFISPTETEGPYPYPGGEINNPLQRINIIEGQTGVPLSLMFTVVNASANCAPVAGARVDIWHCNKDGYYSGYTNTGFLGSQNNASQTWLRGFQITDNAGQAKFSTIYPGWYSGRATHIHVEVFLNNVLRKTTQITFPETVSDAVHTSSLYNAHGINTLRNSSDNIFNDSATNLANETVAITGSVSAGYTGTINIGIEL